MQTDFIGPLRAAIQSEIAKLDAQRAQMKAAYDALGSVGRQAAAKAAPRKHVTPQGTARTRVLAALQSLGGTACYSDIRAKLPEMPVGTVSGTLHGLAKSGAVESVPEGWRVVTPSANEYHVNATMPTYEVAAQ